MNDDFNAIPSNGLVPKREYSFLNKSRGYGTWENPISRNHGTYLIDGI